MAAPTLTPNIGAPSALISDPVSHEPLLEAVSLSPCCHNVNLSTAIKLFGEMGAEALASRKICPISNCGATITSYHPDAQMQAIAQLFFGKGVDRVATLLYPGISAQFTPHGGCWNSWHTPKFLSFRSLTPDSLLEYVHLKGWESGHLEFELNPSEQGRRVLGPYLKSVGVQPAPQERFSGAIVIAGHENLEIIFRILTRHNTLPADSVEFIREVLG
jgi:hypothetical protein